MKPCGMSVLRLTMSGPHASVRKAHASASEAKVTRERTCASAALASVVEVSVAGCGSERAKEEKAGVCELYEQREASDDGDGDEVCGGLLPERVEARIDARRVEFAHW
eukprot:scaffold62088_cov30-Tisochrysis_lutea.AAC.6